MLQSLHGSAEGFLETLLSQPTSPFRESHVVGAVRHELDQAGVPYFLDSIGNIIVGVSGKAEYMRWLKPSAGRQTQKEPVRLFIAHMDHPGFHGKAWKSPTELEVVWHGGSPTQFIENSRVWLADAEGNYAEGHIRAFQLLESGRALRSATVEIPLENRREPHLKATELFGGFSFREPIWQEGKLIYSKAADDLAGVFAIVTLAKELLGRKKGRGGKSKGKKAPAFVGLLTRAEEVGFIGAIGHFEQFSSLWNQSAKAKPVPPVLAVSLETSRALPGAEIGKGPVVRLGDRFGVFDARALQVFSALAEKVLPGKHQKRVMDGGTCEATAAMVYGLPSIGISVPLGNYHNQSFEGGPDSAGDLGPAPEFIHSDDLLGMLELCRALVKPGLTWANPYVPKLKQFKESLRKYRPLLKSG